MTSPRPAPAVLDSRLPTVAPSERSEHFTALIYGRPGVGKTTLAGTAALDPRTAPVLLVDSEGGTLPLSWIDPGQLQIYPVVGAFADPMNQLLNYFDLARASGEPSPYKTVIIDSLTDLATRNLQELASDETVTRKGRHGQPEWTDYNMLLETTRRLVMVLRDLNLNLIVTALEHNENGEIEPAFPGRKLSEVLPGHFDIVARLTVEAIDILDKEGELVGVTHERRLLLSQDGRSLAKDRTNTDGTMPLMLVNPTVSDLLDRKAEGLRRAALTAKDAVKTAKGQNK